MRTKRCGICQTVKPVADFYTHRDSATYGEFHSYCKVCEIAKVRKYAIKKRDDARAARLVLDPHVLRNLRQVSYGRDMGDGTKILVFRHGEHWPVVKAKGHEIIEYKMHATMSEAIRAAESA